MVPSLCDTPTPKDDVILLIMVFNWRHIKPVSELSSRYFWWFLFGPSFLWSSPLPHCSSCCWSQWWRLSASGTLSGAKLSPRGTSPPRCLALLLHPETNTPRQLMTIPLLSRSHGVTGRLKGHSSQAIGHSCALYTHNVLCGVPLSALGSLRVKTVFLRIFYVLLFSCQMVASRVYF